MSEVHRYTVVHMLSEAGGRISYAPHGPEVVMAQAYDELRAENAGLKTGYQAYERVNAELKAENEALRNALAECANSLQGEMLQKFGGQLPEDMHPVTRREYDRDVAEISGYRATLGQGEQS